MKEESFGIYRENIKMFQKTLLSVYRVNKKQILQKGTV